MAGADGVRDLELEPLEVPTKLIKGNKFIKWPKSDGDDSIVATPVTLRIDPNGYIIYWQEPNKDTESLEVSCIRDTRIENYARIPKDPQIREVCGNTLIPLESKCLTIVYGMKFHELCFLNFIAVEENPIVIIKLWADFLLNLAHHPLTWHISVEKLIEKMHTKLKYEVNQFGRIPVKKCIKMFGGNPKRAESALHSVGLMTKGKRDETIEPSDFPLIAFKKVLQLTCQRPELDKVFAQLGGRRLALSLEQMMRFINTDQRDSRLNEILHPFLTEEQVESIIAKYEPNIMLAKKSLLSLEGLDAYLQSDENLPVSTAQYGLYQDMTQPLSHYFVNSSHNTYLTGNQYRSRSSAEIYRQCLLAGCRCVELDCWEATTGDEPMITHGFTLCSEVLFKEVIEAISESAFKTTEFPLILSFENHVDNPQQQAKMAEYCREIFGDKLLIDPLSEYPLTSGVQLPSPRELMGKIIIKNKKQRPATDPAKKTPGDEKGAVLQHGSSLDLCDLQSRHKRGSLASGAISFSSPIGSPNFPDRPIPRSSPGVKPLSRGPKTSGPEVSVSHKSPLAVSSSWPINHSENFGASNGSISTAKNCVINSDGTLRSQNLRGQFKTAQSIEEDAIPEKRGSETKSCGGTLPRKNGKRKCSAPTPTVEHVKDFILSLPPPQKQNGEDSKDDEQEETKENEDSQDGQEESISEEQETQDKTAEEDDDDDEDEGQMSIQEYDEVMKEGGTAAKESKAYEAMSSLVNYIQPIRFKSFDIAEKHNRSFEISSFTENGALRLITYYPIEIVNYNKRQLSRIYPRGARVDSSNYNPQLFWNAGCQLVALNFQTLGPNMQLNLGLFEFNNNCGYILKPEHMREKNRTFDPFAREIIDGVVAGSLAIKIISGQFLSASKVSTYVEVDMYGLVADTVKKKYKTTTIYGNGTNPHYDSENFTFKKIVLPALATLRIGVMDSNGNCLGQRFLPLEGLRPGYRYITLRNEGNQPLTMPSLFVHIEVKDYIPEKLEEFASILANPIEYVRKQVRNEEEVRDRKEALKQLMDDDETAEIQQKSAGMSPDRAINGSVNKPKFEMGMPDVIENPLEGNNNQPTAVSVGTEEDKAPKTTATLERPKKAAMELQLQPYEPIALQEIMQSKEFVDLLKKTDKKVTELIKKRREDYELVYSSYFEKPRKNSFFDFLPRSKTDKIKNMKLPFEFNSTLPPEAKKQHMLLLLRQHFEEEKIGRQNLNDTFMKNFDELVRAKQEVELEKLEKVSESEKNGVWARKKVEKDARTAQLSKSVSKDEYARQKEEIIEAHIKESVEELKMLQSLQEQRVEKVKNDQQEVLMSIYEEERRRIDRITQDYNEQLLNIEKIYDIREVDHHRKRGNSNLNISSVTYRSFDDATNDDAESRRRSDDTLKPPESPQPRRSSAGSLELLMPL